MVLATFQFANAQKSVLTVRVQDGSTKDPVENAKVTLTLNGLTVAQGFTSASGIWDTEVTPNVDYQLKVDHISFNTVERKVTAKAAGNTVITIRMGETHETTEEVIVRGVRVQDDEPGTFTNLSKRKIQQQNAGKDMPYVLEQTPSVVTYSDAGAGVGYTGMRIRGLDATRINVTLNGIPYNDAEAHGVFWVDMPDLASSVNSIQVQRGVGTSTNGSSAFGASVNVKTDHINRTRFGSAVLGLGSFGTRRISAQLGTGITKSGWGAQARVSMIQSDGFVDRARSNLYSGFGTIAHYGKKSLFKVNVLLGKEITYQSWYGTPQPKFEGDTAELNRYISQLWISGDDLTNLMESDGSTYNYYQYDDQVDNYTQNHFQTFFAYSFKPRLKGNIGLNYTRGLGYFEEFRAGDSYSFYNLINPIVSGDTQTNGNIIRRRWLNNHFFGTIFSLDYRGERLDWVVGGGQHFYLGGHYGEVISAQHYPAGSPTHRYYDNDSRKSMSNIYAKATYDATSKVKLYGDAQIRRIGYTAEGRDNDGATIDLDVDFLFFNPKAGISFNPKPNVNMYFTYGRSNREPVRTDLVNSTSLSRPEPEQVNDFELGIRNGTGRLTGSINAYWMDFKNQLVLTGKVNDVGANTRENVAESFRRGVEISAQFNATRKTDLFANVTLSQNQIKSYTEYVYGWDASETMINTYSNTDIAFSPGTIANAGANFRLTKNLSAMINAKHVGSQFLDNTSSPDRQLDAYTLLDGSLSFNSKLKGKMPINIDLFLYNLTNTSYAANGYTFSGVLSDQRESFNYVYPQAGFHFMLRFGFRF